MLFTPRTLFSSSAAILIVFGVVYMIVSSSYGFQCSSLRPHRCDCFNTPDGYELRCPAFTVQVKPKAVVYIQCDINVVSDFSVLNGTCIGEADMLIIRLCRLPSVSLRLLMQNMGLSNVSNVQLTYPGVDGNSATTVTRELFHGLTSVTSLTLHTDGTTQLKNDVFTDMPNLTFIDLKSNNFVLPNDVFCRVMKLQVLQLCSNNQTYLEPRIFHNLTHLRILVLSGNMSNLSRAFFSDIKNLESLNMSSIIMTGLPSDLLVDLTRLRNINLYANEFVRLPQKFFLNNSLLETVRIQDNKRTLNTLPHKMLANLSKLKIVQLSNCNMSTLPEDLLWGSASIHTISLNNNDFITFPETLFKDCRGLEFLDISYNRITDLPNRLFSTVMNLKSLKINNNQLSVITNQLFLSLRNLVVLDLKDNRLTHVETQAFEMLRSLKTVNMSNNMLTFDETSENGTTSLSPLKSCRQLEDIQLENNFLNKIFYDWRHSRNLKTLNLACNRISQLPYADLHFDSVKDTTVNVTYNNISEIDIIRSETDLIFLSDSIIGTSILVPRMSVANIYIEGNLIKCDCKSFSAWNYRRLLSLETKVELIMLTNSSNFRCVKLEEYKKNLVYFVPLKFYTCLLKNGYIPNCPEHCSCLITHSGNALLLDCKKRTVISMSKREDTSPNLSKAVFTHVQNLEILEIDDIKMSSLPSDLFQDLFKLQYVRLHANNFLNLPPNLFLNNQNLKAVSIENNRQTLNTLPTGFFSNLTALRVVTLRSCNMSTLPEDLLWGSEAIEVISVSNNAFITLPELLFKDCGSLRILDISYNRIKELPIRLFRAMTGLYMLKINNNQLFNIPKDLFLPLGKLAVLDLKDNRLRHIETEAFIGLKYLHILDMSNNMLTFEDTSRNRTMGLSPLRFCDSLVDIQLVNNSVTKIFSDWRNLNLLETLNLAHNKISQIQAEDLDFIGAENIFVNISYNYISDMDIFEVKSVFKYVSESVIYNVPITHFSIEGNPINCDCKVYRFLQYNGKHVTAEIKISTKTATSGLQCLELEPYSGQMFWKIPVKPFICLFKIKYSLNCPKQCICLIFPTTKKMVVECHQTNLTSMPAQEDVQHNLSRGVFSDVHNLELLDIKTNRMTNLPPDLFANFTKLRKINLYANEFQSFPQNMFINNPDLGMINIENNKQTLRTLPPRLFSDLINLKEVRLNSCNISTLPEDLLWRSTSINTISLSNNALTTLPEHLFIDCKNLQILDISFNLITDLPNDLFYKTRNLKTLRINNNQLTVITNNLFSFLNNLEVLNLKYNKLTHIAENALSGLTSLKTVDMSNNMLSFEHPWSPFRSSLDLQIIQLANNSLTGIFIDWHSFEDLRTLNLAHNKISQLRVDDLDFHTTKNTLVNISYNNITEIVLFDTESYVKYVPGLYGNGYNIPRRQILTEGNPINCHCKLYSLLQHRGNAIIAEAKLIIENESNNLQCIPKHYTSDDLNTNIPIKYFTCLFQKGFSLNCPHLCNCLFRPSDKALRVDCQQRNLTSMPGALPDLVFSKYTELNLSGNQIKSVKYPLGPGYYKVTKYILSDNVINEINMTAFSPKLQILELDGNWINQLNKSSMEFLMNCTSLTQLTLHNNPWSCDCTSKDFVSLIQNIYNLRMIKLLNNVTCKNGKEILKISPTELCPAELQIALYVSYTVAALGLLIGLLLTFYNRFKTEIKIWLYAHRCCLWFVNEEELDQDKSYDAFVSYAHQDEAFVLDHLVPRLEDDHYTLCLHLRDWIPGEFIQAQIVRSVEASRRTLIVLSPAFLESVWGIMEFRVAHEQALKEGRVRVIVILYGDIGPTDKLPSELQAYITMNTYAKWGDKWFWEKLRYAMPHSSKLLTEIPLQGRA